MESRYVPSVTSQPPKCSKSYGRDQPNPDTNSSLTSHQYLSSCHGGTFSPVNPKPGPTSLSWNPRDQQTDNSDNSISRSDCFRAAQRMPTYILQLLLDTFILPQITFELSACLPIY